MIFVFGFDAVPKVIGPVAEKECPNCKHRKHWLLYKVKEVFSLFFIPLFPVRTFYKINCTVCNLEKKIGQEDYDEMFPLALLNQEAIDSDMDYEEYENRLKKIGL